MKNQSTQQFTSAQVNKSVHLKLVFLILFVCLIISACKKDKPSGSIANSKESVMINGISYPVITIGNQKWTTKNYNGAGGIDDQAVNNPNYGKIYTQSEAIIASQSLTDGWRLPTVQDYKTLLLHEGGSEIQSPFFALIGGESARKFRSTTGWVNVQGTNLNGFNAYPIGKSYSADADHFSTFWTATLSGSEGSYFKLQEPYKQSKEPYGENVEGGTIYFAPLSLKCYVRFVKDIK
ncbi:MAG: FISUMP domain-containing protein [Daejeonella sp.]